MARLTPEEQMMVARELAQNPQALEEFKQRYSGMSQTGGATQQPQQLGGLLGGVQQSLRMLPSIMQNRAPSAAELGQTTKLTPSQELEMFRMKEQIKSQYDKDKIDTKVVGGDLYKINPDGSATLVQEGKDEEPISRQIRREKALGEVIDLETKTPTQKKRIENAKDAADRIPTGLLGGPSRFVKSRLLGDKQLQGDWQKIKMVLLDAALMNIAQTKGAISDREMATFMSAAANDDLSTVSQMKPVFEKLLQSLDDELISKQQQYKTIYGENTESGLSDEEAYQEYREYLKTKGINQ